MIWLLLKCFPVFNFINMTNPIGYIYSSYAALKFVSFLDLLNQLQAIGYLSIKEKYLLVLARFEKTK